MKLTDEILNEIKASSSYIPQEMRLNTELSTFLKEELQSVNLKKMFTSLDIDVVNGYKYIRGERKLKRDQLIKILVYLEYDFDMVQSTLKQYGFPMLYSKNKNDAALIYCIYNRFTYADIKKYLQAHKLIGLQ